eukprot:5398240-Alexandrium_andersonii.AAC.1
MLSFPSGGNLHQSSARAAARASVCAHEHATAMRGIESPPRLQAPRLPPSASFTHMNGLHAPNGGALISLIRWDLQHMPEKPC